MGYTVVVTWKDSSGRTRTTGTNSSRINSVVSNIQKDYGGSVLKIESQGRGQSLGVRDTRTSGTTTTVYERGTEIGKSLEPPPEPVKQHVMHPSDWMSILMRNMPIQTPKGKQQTGIQPIPPKGEYDFGPQNKRYAEAEYDIGISLGYNKQQQNMINSAPAGSLFVKQGGGELTREQALKETMGQEKMLSSGLSEIQSYKKQGYDISKGAGGYQFVLTPEKQQEMIYQREQAEEKAYKNMGWMGEIVIAGKKGLGAILSIPSYLYGLASLKGPTGMITIGYPTGKLEKITKESTIMGQDIFESLGKSDFAGASWKVITSPTMTDIVMPMAFAGGLSLAFKGLGYIGGQAVSRVASGTASLGTKIASKTIPIYAKVAPWAIGTTFMGIAGADIGYTGAYESKGYYPKGTTFNLVQRTSLQFISAGIGASAVSTKFANRWNVETVPKTSYAENQPMKQSSKITIVKDKFIGGIRGISNRLDYTIPEVGNTVTDVGSYIKANRISNRIMKVTNKSSFTIGEKFARNWYVVRGLMPNELRLAIKGLKPKGGFSASQIKDVMRTGSWKNIEEMNMPSGVTSLGIQYSELGKDIGFTSKTMNSETNGIIKRIKSDVLGESKFSVEGKTRYKHFESANDLIPEGIATKDFYTEVNVGEDYVKPITRTYKSGGMIGKETFYPKSDIVYTKSKGGGWVFNQKTNLDPKITYEMKKFTKPFKDNDFRVNAKTQSKEFGGEVTRAGKFGMITEDTPKYTLSRSRSLIEGLRGKTYIKDVTVSFIKETKFKENLGGGSGGFDYRDTIPKNVQDVIVGTGGLGEQLKYDLPEGPFKQMYPRGRYSIIEEDFEPKSSYWGGARPSMGRTSLVSIPKLGTLSMSKSEQKLLRSNLNVQTLGLKQGLMLESTQIQSLLQESALEQVQVSNLAQVQIQQTETLGKVVPLNVNKIDFYTPFFLPTGPMSGYGGDFGFGFDMWGKKKRYRQAKTINPFGEVDFGL